MATTKRERQKAARREKMEQMQKSAKRRQSTRRLVIIGIVAILVLGTGTLLFADHLHYRCDDDHLDDDNNYLFGESRDGTKAGKRGGRRGRLPGLDCRTS
jgi:hypothetical protein